MRRRVMVEKCICHDVPFTRIVEWAQGRDTPTEAQVREAFGCGSSCGMCRNYIRRVLETGLTSIELMVPDHEEKTP
ncbi:MAG: (2Fe-2S)-binding protein [Phycisphaerales bacterium]|nr:(2Fe-2S)-binding protein [Phycisphaerales bacterium]